MNNPRGKCTPIFAAIFLLLFPLLLSAAAPNTSHGPSEAIFIAQVVVLILFGRLIGELMSRIGQPVIMGQLIAGVILGPSVFGAFLPDLQHALFPGSPEQKAMLNAVSQLGILMILLLTGMETDLALVRNSRRAAFAVSMAGIAIPFVCGIVLGEHMPEDLLPNPTQRFVTSLFLGTALSISSVKIVAILVRDLGFLRRRVGQVIVASAIIDDTLGWIIMSVVFGLALHGGVDVPTLTRSILGTLVFLGVSFTVGRRLVFLLIRWANDKFESELPVIAMILIITGVMALITDAIGVHTVLGAFVAGILIGQSPILTGHIEEQLRGLIVALFMPVFFGMAGLSADLRSLATPEMLYLTLAIIAIASIGKFTGALLGGRVGGLSVAESLAVGCGMNARGSTEIIIATFGLTMGVLTQSLFTAIVTMAVVTTLSMPPMLRWAFGRLPLGQDERDRLEREQAEAQGFISNLERLLVTVDASPSGQLASHLVGLLAGARGMPATALHLNYEAKDNAPEGQAQAERTASVLSNAATSGGEAAESISKDGTADPKVDVALQVAEPTKGDEAIATEAKKGYGVLIIGREPSSEGREFHSQITDSAVAFGGPVAIVSARGVHRNLDMDVPLNILVPITGTRVSRQGAELAIALAQGTRGRVTALYVTGSTTSQTRRWINRLTPTPAVTDAADAAIQDIVGMGKLYGVEVHGVVRSHRAAENAILREANGGDFNLVVIGVTPRAGEQLVFGEVAADLLERAECSIVFFTSEAPAVTAPTQQLQDNRGIDNG